MRRGYYYALHTVERGNYPDAPDQSTTTIPISKPKTKVCHKLLQRAANLSFNIYYILGQALFFVIALERPTAFTSALIAKPFAALLMDKFIILCKTSCSGVHGTTSEGLKM